MVDYVSNVHKNWIYANGSLVLPYAQNSGSPDIPVPSLAPRIRPYSGWSSYKNVKSGDYNRALCWPCAKQQGFNQDPGVYPLNIDSRPPYRIPQNYINWSQEDYDAYVKRRMDIFPGNIQSSYVNYFNNQCYQLPPERYIKTWPSELLESVDELPAEGWKTITGTKWATGCQTPNNCKSKYYKSCNKN